MASITFQSLLLASRPKTLTAALIPVFVGTGLAWGLAGKVDWLIFACTLLSALGIQIGTNFFNDALDFEKGADTSERVGPKRVTQSGQMTAKQVKLYAIISFALAILLAIPLVVKGGWIIVAIGLLSLLFGYLYTGGPFPLAYVGLGDIFVIIFFGLVAVAGTFYLHTGVYLPETLVAGLQVGLLSTSLIAINNARDIEQDKKANKKTLAVRFGFGFARWEIVLTQIIPLALCFYWWRQDHHLAAFLPMVSLIWSWTLVLDTLTAKPDQRMNDLLAQAAKIHLVFGICLAFGFVY